MEVITQIGALREALAARAPGTRTALVPTMGALHAGHLSLLTRARCEADLVVASIFVNPMQFGPREDLVSYPRPFEADLEACRRAEVDIVFAPSPEEMYPAGFCTRVALEGPLTEALCGAFRPGHYAGVATVVLKLLNLVDPQVAYFGQKDYQQWRVLCQLVRDLDLAVEVVRCPTVRESDGLALSSRNAYLTARERAEAAAIPRALGAACSRYLAGERDPGALEAACTDALAGIPLRVQYLHAVNPETLGEVRGGDDRLLLALAGHLGKTRLIDNALLEPESPDLALAAFARELPSHA